MDLARPYRPGAEWFIGAHANNKEQLLLDLASRAAASLNLDPKSIFNALQAREELGSTGLGEGFALPHARIEGLDRFFGMFARLNAADSFRTRSMPSPSILFFFSLVRRRPTATTSPRSPPSPGTCATRNSPLDCAELQALPLCAAYFAIPNIRDVAICG